MPRRFLPAVALIALASPRVLPAEQARPLRVIAFGDSTTAPRNTIQEVYADRLVKALAKHRIPIEVINAGVGGNTTEHARRRFERDVLSRAPNLVVIQFGINDSALDVWKDPPATAPRVAVDRYRENLLHFVRTLKDRGVQVILMTPNPLRWVAKTKSLYGKPPYDPDDPQGFDAPLSPYRTAVREVADQEGAPLIDVFQAFADYAKRTNRPVDDLLLDGMHPNDEGHRIVAELLAEQVVKLER